MSQLQGQYTKFSEWHFYILAPINSKTQLRNHSQSINNNKIPRNKFTEGMAKLKGDLK